MPTKRTIEVIPNPFIALDQDGIPQGVVGRVPVGAQIDLLASQKTGKNRYYFPLGKTDGVHVVPYNGDNVTSVLAGELLVTNIEDALLCGISEDSFLDAEEALAAERKKAEAYYRSVKGDDAKVADIPREPMKLEEDETAPIVTSAKQLSPYLTKEG